MTLYLLDANVLIRAHEDYYPVDRIPQFWAWLLTQAEAGAVKMPLQIYNEVAPSRGLLSGSGYRISEKRFCWTRPPI
jgi:hypothetical protein